MRTQPIPTLATAGLLALLALPGAAVADDGPVPVTDQARAHLKAGHDYALGIQSRGTGTVQLVAPGGRVLVSRTEDTGFYEDQVEFRAPYTATYTIRASEGTRGWVDPDCAGGTRSYCHLAQNHERGGLFSSGNDADWFATKLAAGRRYTLSYASPRGEVPATLSFNDTAGRSLARQQVSSRGGTLSFVPRKTGTYFLGVSNDDGDFGGGYTIALH
jgi:hypothetical protein